MKATDGNEVLNILKDSAPDIVILDADLPILDGFQICRIMKSPLFQRLNNTLVILMSKTYRNSILSQLALSVGVYGFLNMPFTREDVLLLINNGLSPEAATGGRRGIFKGKAKIMIADSDRNSADTLKDFFCKEGYEVFVSQNEKDILSLVNREKPNILFLDGDTAGSHGYDILKRIKEISPETVTVVITSHDAGTTIIEFLKAGAADYIIKPFDVKNLPLVCDNALKRHDINLINKHQGEEEQKLFSLVEGMMDGVILTDTKGKPTLVNNACKEILKSLEISMDDDRSLARINDINIKEMYNEIFDKNQRYVSSEIKTRGEEERHFIVIASPLKTSSGENIGAVIVLRNVTREFQLQSQLVKSERLFAVSNLVAGAAHELNNPLAGIQLCTELVMNDRSISEKAKVYLDKIQKEAEQIQGVVKSLLTFTGNFTLSKNHVNINAIVEEIIRQKAYQYDHENIKVIKLLDDTLPSLFVDGQQMRRVLLNLLENACVSMSESQNEKRLTIQTEIQNNLARITISDTGVGIPKEHLTKIFEPFFTKRKSSKHKGTGLGLSVAHSIVSQHNGRIYAKSDQDSGATFVIELPIA
jgi:signal transduction histidine kinase/response regulator RpfG family c-di-GMP phosphodiesterase